MQIIERNQTGLYRYFVYIVQRELQESESAAFVLSIEAERK